MKNDYKIFVFKTIYDTLFNGNLNQNLTIVEMQGCCRRASMRRLYGEKVPAGDDQLKI